MVKVNLELLPVKAHYFFFFAALGPLLPQMNVYGRQLGVSPQVMGLVTAVLPLLWGVAKPCFGYLVDYFTNQRKLIFMLLIAVMSGSYCGLWFLPEPADSPQTTVLETVRYLNGTIYLRAILNTSMYDEAAVESEGADNRKDYSVLKIDGRVFIGHKLGYNDSSLNNETSKQIDEQEGGSVKLINKHSCHWDCGAKEAFDVWLGSEENITEMYIDEALTNDTCAKFDMVFIRFVNDIACEAKENCNLLCVKEGLIEEDFIEDKFSNVSQTVKLRKSYIEPMNKSESKTDVILKTGSEESKVNVDARETVSTDAPDAEQKIDSKQLKSTIVNSTNAERNETNSDESTNIYGTVTFWGFVVLMCLGTVAFNVANCIGDAVCFDVLGAERASAYGAQRAWGTAGYGATALLGGWLVDLASGGARKDFTPAFLLAAAFTMLDLLSCRRLRLPKLSGPNDEESKGALRAVLRSPRVLVFLLFAVVAGMFDSFIIYYMFWYIEELAELSGTTESVKLLEGVIVFGQSFGGELIFFFLSGGILKRYGHGTTMSVCLLCYGLRLALVSLVTNPWYLVPLETVMQGPTYALCYATIVGYAAAVAPPGHSATVQGIVAGMDDGLGFALGSLVGGQLYGRAGGAGAFRAMAAAATAAALLHALLHRTVLARAAPADRKVHSVDGADGPEVERMLDGSPVEKYAPSSAVYRETVLPLHPSDGKDVGTDSVR